MTQNSTERPHGLGEIVGGIANDVQDLVRGEIALARAELDEKLHRVVVAAIWLIGGALVSFAGLVVVIESAAAVLSFAIPAWAALLIVGLVIVAIGGLLAWSGLGMLSLKALTPDRTMAGLQKDAHIVKEHI